ncbi:MAG: type I secretion system permease/ATPase, partial [Sphaerospermopsis sp. SIO1G2]|nr:type I secretion system permease/ATPase [Sphaerospermopsis sp. SIO1G2]
LALAGGTLLILATFANQILSRGPQATAQGAQLHAEAMSGQLKNEAEVVQALGMRAASFTRWQKLRDASLKAGISAADVGGTFSSGTKTFRLFLQSAMLGLGAYLVLQGQLTPGAMIAGSILLGRALAPVEQAIGQWPLVQRAQQGWNGLAVLLSEIPAEAERTPLPRPRAKLEAQQATVIPPGETQSALRIVSFKIEPGTACGVVTVSRV